MNIKIWNEEPKIWPSDTSYHSVYVVHNTSDKTVFFAGSTTKICNLSLPMNDIVWLIVGGFHRGGGDGAGFRAALLSGPPGIGKTTTATLVCKEAGFSYFETNASDSRSKTILQETIGGAIGNTTLMDFMSKGTFLCVLHASWSKTKVVVWCQPLIYIVHRHTCICARPNTTQNPVRSWQHLFSLIRFSSTIIHVIHIISYRVNSFPWWIGTFCLRNVCLHCWLFSGTVNPTSTGNKKHCVIMDEVDGMAGNEDRGGMQELIQLIKSSHIPIICICNDRQSQKIRSLANHCFDLRFQRPRVEQIKVWHHHCMQYKDMSVFLWATELCCQAQLIW